MITITKEDTQLVRRIARRYARPNLPEEDLMQEGYIGLISAKKHFDPTRGISFGSYAAWWVRKYILSALKEYGHIVRLPQRIHPTDYIPHTVSLDQALYSENGDTITLQDTTPEMDDTPNRLECANTVHRLLGNLNPRRQYIVRHYFGIDTPPMGIRQMAEQIGMTEDNVYAILERSLKQMKKMKFF